MGRKKTYILNRGETQKTEPGTFKKRRTLDTSDLVFVYQPLKENLPDGLCLVFFFFFFFFFFLSSHRDLCQANSYENQIVDKLGTARVKAKALPTC